MLVVHVGESTGLLTLLRLQILQAASPSNCDSKDVLPLLVRIALHSQRRAHYAGHVLIRL